MTYDGPVLLDMSAWARILLGTLTSTDGGRFDAAVRDGQVAVCEPFLLEALYSARSNTDYRHLQATLVALPRASSPAGVLGTALAAQAALAQTPGISHRVKVIDLVLAVIAHHHGFGVLHYDHDYDVISRHSPLTCRSVWIARRGSLS